MCKISFKLLYKLLYNTKEAIQRNIAILMGSCDSRKNKLTTAAFLDHRPARNVLSVGLVKTASSCIIVVVVWSSLQSKIKWSAHTLIKHMKKH